MGKMAAEVHRQLCDERESLLEQFHDRLEVPMLVLSFVWLALFVVEMIRELSRHRHRSHRSRRTRCAGPAHDRRAARRDRDAARRDPRVATPGGRSDTHALD
jgi:hypothetical protein